jgi:tetratricopeptide (TPR) repeat protein
MEPRAAIAGNNLAAIYADDGENLDLAQRLAESAADQFPMHPEVQDTLGFIYYQRHQLGPAIRRFEQSIAADPRNAMYHYHLGLAYTKNGEPDRARRALEAALALNPQMTDARHALASLQE